MVASQSATNYERRRGRYSETPIHKANVQLIRAVKPLLSARLNRNSRQRCGRRFGCKEQFNTLTHSALDWEFAHSIKHRRDDKEKSSATEINHATQNR